MSEAPKKKAPSPRVAAAQLLIAAMAEPKLMTSEAMTEKLGSRIDVKKRTKVIDAMTKLANKFHARLAKIVDRFENPPPRKPGATPPGFGRKKGSA
jgi:hypothetical protein